jgi:glutaredoxin-like protein
MSTTDHAANELIVYGANWCGDCRRTKRLLDAQGITYTWIDLDEHPEAVAVVERINKGMRSIPTLLFPDGSVMVEPSDPALLQKLGR